MMDEAICQVAPEWWGAGADDEVNVDMAVWGCQLCPVDDCLETFAAAQGRMYRLDDLGPVVVAGLYGRGLFDAVNRIAPARVTQPGCGTNAGYRRHQRAGETACERCRAAHRVYSARCKTRSAA